METVNQSKQPATIQVLDDLQSNCYKQNQKLNRSINEILSAAKNLKHVFETSASTVKELLQKDDVLPKPWADVMYVLAKATNPTQKLLLGELIDGLEKCTESAYIEHLEHTKLDWKSKSVDLLLIGSAGNGKSATGNSILGKTAFHTAAGMSATEESSRIGTSTYKDLTISVVETPGVDTNGRKNFEVLEIAINLIKESLEMCDYNFTALLIVIKFGSRFTQLESDTIKMIRGVLGNDVIQKYGVCVVTHGDNFEYEMEEEGAEEGKVMTFEEWCQAQEGEIGEIFQECNFRCVLFNNKAKSEAKRLQQIENLLSRINFDQKYCKADFINADEGLAKLTQEFFLPEILKQTCTFVNDISARNISLGPEAASAYGILKTKELIQELQDYKENIIAGLWEDSQMSQILGYLEPLEMQLNSQIKLGNPSKTINAQSEREFNEKTSTSDFRRVSQSENQRLGRKITDVNKETTPKVTEKLNTALEKKCRMDLECLKKKFKTSNKCANDIQKMNTELMDFEEKYSLIINSSGMCFKKISNLKKKLTSPQKCTEGKSISKKWKGLKSLFKSVSKLSKTNKTHGYKLTDTKRKPLETVI